MQENTQKVESHKFLNVGDILATAGIAHQSDDMTMTEGFLFHEFLSESLTRHTRCDWGDIDEEDWQVNDDCAKNGGRILSAYIPKRFPQLSDDLKIWIITEQLPERDGTFKPRTTILFPREY